MNTVRSYSIHTDEELNYLDGIPYLIYEDKVLPTHLRCVYNGWVIMWDHKLNCIMIPADMNVNSQRALLEFYSKDNLPSPVNILGKPKIDMDSSIESFKRDKEANIADIADDIDSKLRSVEEDMRHRYEEIAKLENADNIEIEISITDPLVADYAVSDGLLKIHTKYLTSEVDYKYDGDVYDFSDFYGDDLLCYWGEFIITIPIFSDNPVDISFYNLTRSEDGYNDKSVPHPHVIDSAIHGVCTKACWGEFPGDVSEAMSDGNWDFLIALIMRLLLQPDTEDSAGLFTPNFIEFIPSNQYRKASDVH